MRRRLGPGAALLAAVALTACENQLPTSVDGSLIPVEPVTVEIRIPWSQFGQDVRVFGGFGNTGQLGHGILARSYRDTLDARTLVRFQTFPVTVTAVDTAGSTETQAIKAFTGGRFVLHLDTLASTNQAPVTLSAGRTLQAWDPATATWDLAVDSLGRQVAWPVPGGGPVQELATATWDPAAGDSAVFHLDSAQVAALADTADTGQKGFRFSVEDAGVRLQVNTVSFQVDTRPTFNPDTLVTSEVGGGSVTFIYTPVPEPPPDGIRVGGAPSWRTVFDLNVPDTLDGPSSLCAVAGCPLALTPDRVTHAELVLTPRPSAPSAFQPTDTVRMDVRAVLAPDRLPRAPLGSSFLGSLGLAVPASAFAPGASQEVRVPVTQFIRNQVAAVPAGGTAPPSSLALLSLFEPMDVSFASFYGPGTANEPYLRLLVTVAQPVGLP